MRTLTDADPRNALRRLREARGLTQHDIAQRLGVDIGTVSRWERGAVVPQPGQRRKLAEAYQVSIAALEITARPEPVAAVDPLAFLEEPPIGPVDPRVHRSQQEWRDTRRALNAHRRDLTCLAASVYPPEAQLEQTGLITGPGWIPEKPVPLEHVELEYRPDAAPPQLDGTEPESANVRPLLSLAHPHARYSHAIRDVDAPRLFENRASWRLLELEWTGNGGRMAFGDCTYFSSVDINEVVSHELALVALEQDGTAHARAPRLRDLPYRRMLGSPFALERRPVMPAVSTLTIRAGNAPSFLLHRRDSRSVAMAGGMLQVVPSGIFQPSSVMPAVKAGDFSIWKNIMREFAEELLGLPECDGDGNPVDYAAEPFATLERARTDGRIQVHCLGVALDALTLVGEVLTVAVLEPDLFDDFAHDFVETNTEGTIVNQRLAFDEVTVRRLLESGRMAPAGAGCLELAWRHRGLLL